MGHVLSDPITRAGTGPDLHVPANAYATTDLAGRTIKAPHLRRCAGLAVGFDCSALVGYVLTRAGYDMSPNSSEQRAE